MRTVMIVGLAAVVTDAVLSLLMVGPLGLSALGLLLLIIGRTRTRGPIDSTDLAIGATGLAFLLLSAMQPMYWLIPSQQLLAGCALACLSRLWRANELAICLLLPGLLVTITTIGALLWLGGSLPGPHGAAELTFALASLYGPISAAGLAGLWWLQRARRSNASA